MRVTGSEDPKAPATSLAKGTHVVTPTPNIPASQVSTMGGPSPFRAPALIPLYPREEMTWQRHMVNQGKQD